VRQEITIADLTGRLLPAVPTPQRVTGVRLAYDPDTGTLLHPERLTPGLRYVVNSAYERPDPNLLTSADVPSGQRVARTLRVGDGVPAQLRRLADELSADNGAPYERALAIEQFLAEHYRHVADAPSGHAYPNLSFFLFGPGHAGGRRGTSEQFAATFAVLGRLTGLPTRVVVGFRSPPGGGPVRAADAYAWPEVLFESLGWVAFDPLPQPDTEPRPVEEDFTPEPEPSSPPPMPSPEPAPSDPPASAAAAVPAPNLQGSRGWPLLAGAGFLLAIVAAGPALVIWLRRSQRRRRLFVGTPAQRVAGAWLETTDTLRLAGQAVDHLTATEVAERARTIAVRASAPEVLVPPIDELAALVNLATFAPVEVTDQDAEAAGVRAMAYRAGLRAGQRWWRRLLWSAHPGPLRRRR